MKNAVLSRTDRYIRFYNIIVAPDIVLCNIIFVFSNK